MNTQLHIHDIVASRIRHFKSQDPFYSKYALALEHIKQLETFLAFLKTIDRWHKVEPLASVIGEKDMLLEQLKSRVAELEAQLKQAKEYDANEKIVITNSYIATLMDLLDQIQNLTATSRFQLILHATTFPHAKATRLITCTLRYSKSGAVTPLD